LKIYDETASLIADLGIRGRITIEEMNFLLNLLEMVLIKKDKKDFINIMKRWKPAQEDNEIDQIIKATLLTIDFNDQSSIEANSEVIIELIDAKNSE